MPAQRSIPPVWMMGLTNVTFGMVATFTVTTVPQILADQGVPGGHIAAITAFIAFNHHNVLAVEIAAFTSSVAAALYQGAVGGWMGSLIEKEQDGLLERF